MGDNGGENEEMPATISEDDDDHMHMTKHAKSLY